MISLRSQLPDEIFMAEGRLEDRQRLGDRVDARLQSLAARAQAFQIDAQAGDRRALRRARRADDSGGRGGLVLSRELGREAMRLGPTAIEP